MASLVRSVSRAFDPAERSRLLGFYAAIVAIHIIGLGALLTYGFGHPAFLALGALAYSFGLRHAFDADHISAIDNTTRKLLQQGEKPMGVGFFFSLGHSTVVFLIALALGFAVKSIVEGVVGQNGQLKSIGGIVGTSVSGGFLVIIGLLNLLILLGIIQVYRRMRRGEFDRQSLGSELVTGGVMTRAFGRLFKVVTQSWHMYPIGFLFGLGFDTASEVALLAISAGAAAQGLPFLAVVALPVIFAAGMSLMDTTDGAFMAKAYSWAFSNPIRRVFYNITVTSLSVFVALFVGVVELTQILIQLTNAQGQPWDAIAGFDFIGKAGFAIVALFILTWLVAIWIYKARNVEERWGAMIEDRPNLG